MPGIDSGGYGLGLGLGVSFRVSVSVSVSFVLVMSYAYQIGIKLVDEFHSRKCSNVTTRSIYLHDLHNELRRMTRPLDTDPHDVWVALHWVYDHPVKCDTSYSEHEHPHEKLIQESSVWG